MSFLTRNLIQRFKQSCFLQNIEQNPAIKKRSRYSLENFRIKKPPMYAQVDDQRIKINKRIPYIKDILEKNLEVINLLKSKKPLTTNDWLKARDELFELEIINEKNVDATISNLCFSFENNDAFISYVQFLKSNNYEINLYVSGIYASKLSAKHCLSKSEKQEICDLYDAVRKKHPVLDGDSCVHFIHGLCATDRWEESTELLDVLLILNRKATSPITRIIKTGFDNNNPEFGWKYFTFATDNEFALQPSAFSSYLEYCLRTFKDKRLLEENLLKIFKFCMDKEVLLNKVSLDDYLPIFQSLGYTYSDATISVNGNCKKCSHKLHTPEISGEEFHELSKLFMEKVFVGDNVYLNTTPGEFKNFLKFLERAGPYDIVIDGLNIAFSQQPKNVEQKVESITRVVEYFVNNGKKILLLGRKHMLRWNMNYVKHNAKTFFLDNSSFDDPHLLYATLYGGMDTCFLSGDLMRQHKFLLPKDKQKLFKYWQLSHQYLKHPYSNNIKYPVKFEIIAQNDKNGWHVPYFIGDANVPKDSYDTTINWICLRKTC